MKYEGWLLWVLLVTAICLLALVLNSLSVMVGGIGGSVVGLILGLLGQR